MPSMNERGVDFGDRLDRSCDRDFRKMVNAVVGNISRTEVDATDSRASEAASVPGGSTAGLLLGHV